MGILPAPQTSDLQRARRNAAVGGASVGVAVAVIAIVGPAVLMALSVFVIVVGVVVSLTVIGLVIGVPLIAVGVLGVVGAAIGGSAGLPLALLLGAVSGVVYYEHRLRTLSGGSGRPG